MPALSPEDRLKKLRFRAWRRGFVEADLILGPFADRHAAGLDAAQLDRFESLLDQPDQDLYAWIVGLKPVPPEFDTDVMDLIRGFRFFAREAREQSPA
jgi:antitoxin CptB